ncbi:MAG: YdbH domain-containing protein [Desulfomicrobium apsheronum]|nr:YdbH domain-containing protein [Desulfomicrobium apsheronum]
MSTANGSAPDNATPHANKQPARPAHFRFLRGLLFFLTLFCLVLAVLWIALPRIAQELFVPALARTLHAPELSMDIRRAGFSGLDLGEISLSSDAGLAAEAVLIDWSLSGLLTGRIDRIRILGLSIRVQKNGENWNIPGLPRLQKSSGADSGTMFLPWVDEMSVEGRISLEGPGLGHSFPFSVNGGLDENADIVLNADTALAGQSVSLTLKGNLQQNDFRLTCVLPPASIAALAGMVPSLNALPLAGTVRAEAHASLPPDQKPLLEARLGLDSLRTMLGGAPLTQDGNATLDLAWQDEPRLSLSALSLGAPLPLTLSVADIRADLENMSFGCSWSLTAQTLPGVAFSSPPRVAGSCELNASDQGWSMRATAALDALEARPTQTPGLVLALDTTTLTLDAGKDSAGTRVDGSLALGKLRVTREALGATLSGLNMTVNATASPDLSGTIRLSGARLDAKQPGMALTTTRLDGQCAFALTEQLTLSGVMNAAARASSGDTAALVSLRLPLAWPEPATTSGSVDLDLKWKGNGLAKISSRIAQDLHGASLDGTLSVLPVAVRAPLKGRIDATNISGSWIEMKAAQTITLPGKLTSLIPALGDLSGSARLDATARLDLSSGAAMLPADLKLTGLSLAHATSELTLSDGAVELAFSNLLNMRSEPDGRMNFERLQLGTIILEQGDIHFQIEALHSILVEGCRFEWAGGRIGSQAFRINPNVEDYTVELYCDRVEMAQALEQFGMTQAQGGGTANGRIPVRWADGNLTFANGFLYSTPGEKGVLRVKGTEILTAGIPPGTPQYGQLDLAAEALKDFTYDWARIRINTQERELVVSLELDGKPEKPLPFSYNRDLGGFARVEASSPGSVFQGIRLDVNFRLPLDQLLQYRQLLELMKNGG